MLTAVIVLTAFAIVIAFAFAFVWYQRQAADDRAAERLRPLVIGERAGDTRIFLAVYHPGSATTPLAPDAREDFAAYVTAVMRDTPKCLVNSASDLIRSPGRKSPLLIPARI